MSDGARPRTPPRSILLIVLVYFTSWVALLFRIWILGLSIDSLIAGRRPEALAADR